MQLAKKYGGGSVFGNFANALLRKLPSDEDKKGNIIGTRPLPMPMVSKSHVDFTFMILLPSHV